MPSPIPDSGLSSCEAAHPRGKISSLGLLDIIWYIFNIPEADML
jgi:hypothetical protein